MSKDKAAVALGRKRWAGISKAERKERMSLLAKRRHKIVEKADFVALYDAITKAIK